MPRIRKAVWKEKDLDLKNRKKFRLHCNLDEKGGLMKFYLTLSNSVENI